MYKKKGSILSPISVLLYKVVIKLAPITGVHLLFKNKALDDQIFLHELGMQSDYLKSKIAC
jgi:hypothetical protein